MSNKLWILGCAFSLLLFSCKKDDKISDPLPIEPDYVLPQGNASQAANDRIQQLYDNYGSYFLYNYTQKDFVWVQYTGSSAGAIDTAVLGDPQYAEDMLKFLDDIWLQFLPESFKKGPAIPYRVFLADTIKQYRVGLRPPLTHLFFDYKISGKSLAIAGMNASLRTMTPAEKVAKRNVLLPIIFNYYISNGIITLPAEFYTISDYATVPANPATSPENMAAWRSRGFLPSSYNAVTGAPFEWYYSYLWGNVTTYLPTMRTNDVNAYLLHLMQRTDAQVADFLAYPIIKKKWDLLLNHFKNSYGIDLRAIGNTTYQ
ncbi:MAG: hypothetical protein P0Y53_08325 [Candidatus Pseudobacter hemicellulosilyticus]|uniref:Uncharacterized protein n=1 Tax=Candidatus Pseudobacter hemicellulosilyticus TaxID=3121375 RepID=A0AAJ6BJL0_9BACT|nr:MAG: hypothetical protein P0Y53_08325 [Pseudobacter sp.]